MRRLIKHAVTQLMPRTEQLPGAADTNLDDFIQNLHREAPFSLKLGLWIGTSIYVVWPIFTVGLPLPSFFLPSTLAELHAERVTKSQNYAARQLLFVVKMIGGFCWAADDNVRQAMGLPLLPPDPQTFRTS
ncbi:MAG: hypothetical protein R3A47_09130 [Polyangiales bacterium]